MEETPDPPTILPPNVVTSAPAGSLSRYCKNWDSLTNNSFIKSIVSDGYKIQFSSPVLVSAEGNVGRISNPKDPNKAKILCDEIQKHLRNGVISLVEPNEDQYISRVFTVPKNSGGFRLIIDLKDLNQFINKVHFRMEDKSVIKDILSPNDFMGSIDLKDAFLTVPLHNESKKWCTFEFSGKRYHYNCLPFGLTSSPRIFTKVLKPVIMHLRLKGIKVTFYLDDIFLCAASRVKLLEDINYTISLLCSLGFSINLEKSVLVPQTTLTHLGFSFNSIDMTLSLPRDKFLKIQNFALNLLSSSCSIRDLASFLGLVVNSHEGFLFAPLHYRKIQFFFIKCLRRYDNWDHAIVLDAPSREDIMWWSIADASKFVPTPLKDTKDIVLTTDASTFGWGGFLSSGESISGSWGMADKVHHINFLELKAVLLSLLHFAPSIQRKHILIQSDNTTCVQYINNFGGTHSEKLCFLALDIWGLAEKHEFTLRGRHIPGIKNIQADFYSRHSHLHEYSLSSQAFSKLGECVPHPLVIDLFASNLNHKLPKYVSLSQDDLAWKVDAFSFAWPSNIYFFPPIPLISRCVHKFLQDKVEFGVLVTPAWPAIPMLPLIINCLVANPILIPSSVVLGPLPTRHPFEVVAWPISSSIVAAKAYQGKLQKPSSKAYLPPHLTHTKGCGQGLVTGLWKLGIVPSSLFR